MNGQKIIEGLKEAAAGDFARVHLFDESGARQTWQRVDKIASDHVTIPRARYEALMAVQKAADTYYHGYAQDEADGEGVCGRAQQIAAIELRDSLTALRAAGTPPLPDEIAGLIEDLHFVAESFSDDPTSRQFDRKTARIAASVLRAMAQETERLRKAATPLCIGQPLIGILAKEGAWQSSEGQCIVAADDLHGANPYDRIAELEAERDRWRENYNDVAENHRDRMDAIKLKTFEECARLMENWNGEYGSRAAAIRSRAQMDEEKTESDADLPTAEDVRGILAEGKTETGK